MVPTLFVCATLISAVPSDADTELIPLQVRPMAAPVPLLKVQLLPEFHELEPGNQVQEYMKCFMEQQRFFFDEPMQEQREKWLKMPRSELPTVRVLQNYDNLTVTRIDRAARRNQVDWQMLTEIRRDGIATLVPDIQQIRLLADVVRLRLRGQIAVQDFAGAIHSLKTLFALARSFEEHPALIGHLVGGSIADHTLDAIHELVEQPACPNLYWGLTYLPDPLVGLHKGWQGERDLLASEFARVPTDRVMTQEEIQKALDEFRKLYRWSIHDPAVLKRFNTWLDEQAEDSNYLDRARQELAKAGYPKVKNLLMLSGQILLLKSRLDYEVWLDRLIARSQLPYWQAKRGLAAIAAAADRPENWAAKIVYPIAQRSWVMQLRLRQHIAMLRVVEAVRLYAAGHNGELPETLNALEVPVPPDPVTGQPFAYTRKGQTATLRSTRPDFKDEWVKFIHGYRITMAEPEGH